jgi:ABC-type antimicrobial peptide transport system permease subunit
LPVYKVQTLDQIVSASVSQTRFPTLVLSVFAGLALLLAAVGVYGVLAYTVEQSKHEIGVRMALGAPQAQILRFFLSQGVKWAMLGGGAGLLAAFILVRFIRSMLFEVGPYDPRIFGGGVGMLTTPYDSCADGLLPSCAPSYENRSDGGCEERIGSVPPNSNPSIGANPLSEAAIALQALAECAAEAQICMKDRSGMN